MERPKEKTNREILGISKQVESFLGPRLVENFALIALAMEEYEPLLEDLQPAELLSMLEEHGVLRDLPFVSELSVNFSARIDEHIRNGRHSLEKISNSASSAFNQLKGKAGRLTRIFIDQVLLAFELDRMKDTYDKYRAFDNGFERGAAEVIHGIGGMQNLNSRSRGNLLAVPFARWAEKKKPKRKFPKKQNLRVDADKDWELLQDVFFIPKNGEILTVNADTSGHIPGIGQFHITPAVNSAGVLVKVDIEALGSRIPLVLSRFNGELCPRHALNYPLKTLMDSRRGQLYYEYLRFMVLSLIQQSIDAGHFIAAEKFEPPILDTSLETEIDRVGDELRDQVPDEIPPESEPAPEEQSVDQEPTKKKKPQRRKLKNVTIKNATAAFASFEIEVKDKGTGSHVLLIKKNDKGKVIARALFPKEGGHGAGKSWEHQMPNIIGRACRGLGISLQDYRVALAQV